MDMPDGIITTWGVMRTLEEHPGSCIHWGRGVDGSSIKSMQCGGTQKPAVLITAGVHAHEVGGVQGALQLARELNSRHEIHILALRDPFGFTGAHHDLGHASGEKILLDDDASLLEFLFSHGRQICRWKENYCFQVGEMGFIWQPRPVGLEGFKEVNAYMTTAVRDNPDLFAPLFGSHVMLINPAPYSERNERLVRCWHAWISSRGEWLNLNRGFGEQEQSGEVFAMQLALETIRPGLVIDLQEDDTPGFWLAAPSFPENRNVIPQVLSACLRAMNQNQFSMYSAHQMQADAHRDLEIEGFLQPEREFPGFFWLNQERMGQGQNLLSYAAGSAVALGVESPLQQPLDHRVAGMVQFVSTLIREWESLCFEGKSL